MVVKVLQRRQARPHAASSRLGGGGRELVGRAGRALRPQPVNRHGPVRAGRWGCWRVSCLPLPPRSKPSCQSQERDRETRRAGRGRVRRQTWIRRSRRGRRAIGGPPAGQSRTPHRRRWRPRWARLLRPRYPTLPSTPRPGRSAPAAARRAQRARMGPATPVRQGQGQRRSPRRAAIRTPRCVRRYGSWRRGCRRRRRRRGRRERPKRLQACAGRPRAPRLAPTARPEVPASGALTQTLA